MRIVHLTDIHLSESNIKDFKQFYLKALIEDLRQFNTKKPIDFITITGDLVDKGGSSFSNPDQCYRVFLKEFIEPILNDLDLGKDRMLIIPGNHDVDEKEIDSVFEAGLVSQLKNSESVNELIDTRKNLDVSPLKRIRKFKNFEEELYQGIDGTTITPYESVHVKKYDDLQIGFIALNSAWRCSSKLDPSHLVLGSRQILNAIEILEEKKVDFTIVLLHHPFDFLSEIERQEIKSFIQNKQIDIVLLGHSHRGSTEYTTGNNGNIFTSNSKSAFNNPRQAIEEYQPGYTYIDVDFDHQMVNCEFRKYIKNRVSFDKDTGLSEDGKMNVNLISNETKNEFIELLELCNTTNEVNSEQIDNSLVIYGTDSIAPRELKDLFVLPRLQNSPSSYLDSETEEQGYSLKDLINIDENVLISGDKEKGKTTLLNMIFLEYSQNFHKYKKIPIKVEFKALTKNDFTQLVKRFLNIGTDLAKHIIKTNQIVILIDNLDIGDDLIHAKKRLIKFIEDYPKIKIVSTSHISSETLLTSESSIFKERNGDEKIKEFNIIYIGSVGVKQFKELAIKWFKRKDPEWVISNIEKLIKVFEILRIPRTFFSVSLFLWIIEKQENFKPINKAELVHQFLNYILEGLQLENTSAGSYDYYKKIELLKEISLVMYRKGDKTNNYGLKESSTLNIIESNFSLNQVTFTIPDKLKEFVDKGILTRDNSTNKITFRFESFFQYFLSLNIESNAEFEQEVFSEKKFLNFADEIDFHTGKLRGNAKVLKTMISRLDSAFAPIDNDFETKVDGYLPKNALLLNKIDSKSHISKLKNEKLDNDEIEEVLGSQMEFLPVETSIKIKEDIGDFKEQFGVVLEISARVLKNSENIQKPELVNHALDLIINKSAKYAVFIQSLLVNTLEKNEFQDIPIPKEFIVHMAPIMNQIMLLTWMGTDFLETPLKNKIEKYLKEPTQNISEYELYLCAFLYADLRLPKHVNYLERTIDKINNRYIAELCYFKIFLYYMMRPEGSSLLTEYERLMINCLLKTNKTEVAAKSIVEAQRKRKLEDRGDQIGIFD